MSVIKIHLTFLLYNIGIRLFFQRVVIFNIFHNKPSSQKIITQCR